MADDLKIKVTIQGDDNLSGPAKSASKSLDKLNTSADQTTKSSGKAADSVNVLAHGLAGPVVAGATAVAGGLAYASTKAAEFEKTLSGVKAVTGASTDEMKQLSDLALELGATTSFSATEAAQAIGELAKGGVSVKDSLGGAAQATLDLAAASGEHAAPAAALAANAMSLFNLEGERTVEVANAVAGFANATTGDMNDFKFALSSVGAAAHLAGQDFDQTAVALALMGKAGILGSDAGTSLKTMLLNLVPQTNKQKEMFQQLGLETFNEAKAMEALTDAGHDLTGMSLGEMMPLLSKQLGGFTDWTKATDKQRTAYYENARAAGIMQNAFLNADGSFKDLRDIAGALNESLDGLSEAQRTVALETLFGSDAIRAAAILAEAGAEGFDHMTEAVTGTVTAEEVATEMTNNLTGSLDAMNGSAETAAITLGLELNKSVKEVSDALNVFIGKHIIPFAQEYGPAFGLRLVETVRFLGMVADALGPIIGPIGQGFRAMLDTWGQGLDWVIEQTYKTIVAGVNLKNGIEQLGPNLKTAAEGLGKSIVDGIAAGLNPQVVITKLQSLAGDALQAARDKIEAKSPSRVFAKEVGLPMALGMVEGLEEGAPAVEAAAREVAGRGLAAAAALVREYGLTGGGAMAPAGVSGLAGAAGFISAYRGGDPGQLGGREWNPLSYDPWAMLATTPRHIPRMGALDQSLYGAGQASSNWGGLNVTPNQAAIGARQGVAESLSNTELKNKMGDVGAAAWKAFIEATKTGSLTSGLSAGAAMQAVVDAAKAAGVPQWQQLGATLMEAFNGSLIESTEISRARVAELLSLSQTAVTAAQQIKTAARPDQSYGAGTGGGGTGGTGGGSAHTPFDVRALAAAMAQQPIVIQLDGQRVGQAVRTGQQRAQEQTLTYPSGIGMTPNGVGGVGGGGY